MICDLAETYHLFNYREYSPLLVGTLLVGLKDDSRVKKKISGAKLSLEEMLLARIADDIAVNTWFKTKDAQKNKNRPKSILQHLLGVEKKEEYDTFDTFEEFQKKWNSI